MPLKIFDFAVVIFWKRLGKIMEPHYFTANILSQLSREKARLIEMLVASLSDEERQMGKTEEGCLALLKKELNNANLGNRLAFATVLFHGLLHHSPENTIALIFHNLNWRTASNRAFWSNVIYPALTEAVNISRFSNDALELICDHCAPLIHSRTRDEMETIFSTALVRSASDLYTNARNRVHNVTDSA